MTIPLTKLLGTFIAGVRFESIPTEAIATVRAGFVDCLGVMLAGSLENTTKAVERVLLQDEIAGRSSLYLSGKVSSSPIAAFINGTAAHVLDFDDVGLKGSHPSAVLVPAILAESQVLRASGKDMIAAYIAGYEVWAELIARDSGNYQRKGWHPTGVFGAIAAAAACSRLRGLDSKKSSDALGIAASSACGVMANLGFMVKPTHPGRAASAGVMAARFAAEGVEGAPDAIEHDQGFLRAISPNGDVDLETAPILPPVRWKILEQGLNFKQYPVCYRAHRAIDALIDLKRIKSITSDVVRDIKVSFSKTHGIILKNHRPLTAIDAKFSIEFSLACAFTAGRVGLRELTDEFVMRKDIQDLIEKVSIEIDPREMAGTSGYAEHDFVTVSLKNGEELKSAKVRHARGDSEAPLGTEDLWTKFEDCVAWSRLPINARITFEALQHLEEIPTADALVEIALTGNSEIDLPNRTSKQVSVLQTN